MDSSHVIPPYANVYGPSLNGNGNTNDPSDPTTDGDKKMLYIYIGGGISVLLVLSLVITCCLKKKKVTTTTTEKRHDPYHEDLP